MFLQLSACGTWALKSTALLTFCTSVIRLGLWETNSTKYRQLLYLVYLGIISHRNVAYAYWNQLQVCKVAKKLLPLLFFPSIFTNIWLDICYFDNSTVSKKAVVIIYTIKPFSNYMVFRVFGFDCSGIMVSMIIIVYIKPSGFRP